MNKQRNVGENRLETNRIKNRISRAIETMELLENRINSVYIVMLCNIAAWNVLLKWKIAFANVK